MIVEMMCNDDYFDEYPPHAEIIFYPELIERIIELNKTVTKVKAYKITDWDETPDFLSDENGKEWEGRSECKMLNVCENSISWGAYIKNTNITIETYEISMSEILEINKVLKVPEKELPLLINDLKSKEAKRILEERLKGQ